MSNVGIKIEFDWWIVQGCVRCQQDISGWAIWAVQFSLMQLTCTARR